jgi:pimeloyl-ACP methyl ester carboxylesterase
VEDYNTKNEKPVGSNNLSKVFMLAEGFKQIEDIPCLIIWGEKDNLIPTKYYDTFNQMRPKDKYELIADAGHVPFVEKTALLHEKSHTFLMQEDRS